jgi:hypothetical protein
VRGCCGGWQLTGSQADLLKSLVLLEDSRVLRLYRLRKGEDLRETIEGLVGLAASLVPDPVRAPGVDLGVLRPDAVLAAGGTSGPP